MYTCTCIEGSFLLVLIVFNWILESFEEVEKKWLRKKEQAGKQSNSGDKAQVA